MYVFANLYSVLFFLIFIVFCMNQLLQIKLSLTITTDFYQAVVLDEIVQPLEQMRLFHTGAILVCPRRKYMLKSLVVIQKCLKSYC